MQKKEVNHNIITLTTHSLSLSLSLCVCVGALSFLLVWFAFLWLWSIPVILIEYGVGRYTHKALIESWGTLIGPSYRFFGGFPVIVSFCIA